MPSYANSMNLRTEDYYFLSKALRKKFFCGEEEIRALRPPAISINLSVSSLFQPADSRISDLGFAKLHKNLRLIRPAHKKETAS